MKSKGTRYSTEFKIKAVELSKSRNKLSTVASELNISHETLQFWTKLIMKVSLKKMPKNIHLNRKKLFA